MELARAIGLNVAPCEILEGVYPLFVTERYDRIKDKQDMVHRLHQQDFCQANGVVLDALVNIAVALGQEVHIELKPA